MKALAKNQTMLAELDKIPHHDMGIGEYQLSRRTFCRGALVGSSLFSLMLWKSDVVFAQEDESDSQELIDLVSLGALDDDETPDPDKPDFEDPSIDEFHVFLPGVQGGSGIQVSSGASLPSAPFDATSEQTLPISNRERALRAAISQIGYHEEPLGSNRTKYGRYFGVNQGKQWCVYFASWAFDSTSNHDGKVPWPAGSVSGLLNWAHAKEQQGRHVLFSQPRRGDILIMKGGGVSHVGIVRWVYNDGLIRTVEGNTARKPPKIPNDRLTVWVANRRRDLRALRASGIPCYFVRVPKNPW